MKGMMEFLGAALVSITGIVGIFAISDRKKDRKRDKGSSIAVLSGELVDAAYDRETGFTRVEVRDACGITQTGFSTLPEKEINALYAGKGFVQIVTQTVR